MSRLHTRRFGRALTFLSETESTNDVARRLAADGSPEGTAVIAVNQSGGRGRRGRTFFSPAGGVYLSVILRPHSVQDPGCITACAAVAAARAIEHFSGPPVAIKWVNDLFLGGKKVGGILTESALNTAGEPLYGIVGIGINVDETEFPPSLRNTATSLAREGYTVSRAALAAALLDEWEAAYDTLTRGTFWDEYRSRSLVLGKTVFVCRGNDRYPAIARRIDDTGRLWVCREDGTEEPLSSGEVSLRQPEQA